MSYAEYLKDVLRPLHVYDLDGGTGAYEISVLGGALDDVYNELETILREMIPLTAQSYGLEKYESILPCSGVGNLDDRRNAIAAMTYVSDFGLNGLRRALLGSGIKVELNEYGPETVIVSFNRNGMSDDEIEQVKQRIEQIIPCHLAIIYETAYATWRQLEHENLTWNKIEFEDLTWHGLQTYDVEVED